MLKHSREILKITESRIVVCVETYHFSHVCCYVFFWESELFKWSMRLYAHISSVRGTEPEGLRVGSSLTRSWCCRALLGPSWNQSIVGFLSRNLMDSFIDIQMKRRNGKTAPAQNASVMLTVWAFSLVYLWLKFVFIRPSVEILQVLKHSKCLLNINCLKLLTLIYFVSVVVKFCLDL